MNEALLLPTSPQKLPDRGRRCAIWVSPWVRDTVIIDTAMLRVEETRYAGRDTLPPDCLLVVVSPAENERLRQLAMTLAYPTSGPAIAAHLIDRCCRNNPTLRQSWRW